MTAYLICEFVCNLDTFSYLILNTPFISTFFRRMKVSFVFDLSSKKLRKSTFKTSKLRIKMKDYHSISPLYCDDI